MITDDHAPAAGDDGDEPRILALLDERLRTCYSGCRRHPSREGLEKAVEHALLALAELCYSAPKIRALLAARLKQGRATYGPWVLSGFTVLSFRHVTAVGVVLTSGWV